MSNLSEYYHQIPRSHLLQTILIVQFRLGQIMCKFSADRLFISADVFKEYTLQKAAYVAAQTGFCNNMGLRRP